MSAVDDEELRELAINAADGDGRALEQVIAGVQDRVYRLALRMLWHPQDAEDATQEALIRIMTHIGSYRGEAAFGTWAYRVAANHILNFRKSRVERENLDFRRYSEDLVDGLCEPDAARPDADLLAQEVKLGCTMGMLLCLDRVHRLAYVLTDIFDLSSGDAAFICDITPAALRKRASRARAQLREFVGLHCGLVNKTAPCRCDRRVNAAVHGGRVDPESLNFAAGIDPQDAVGEMERMYDLASLMRNHPDYQAPGAVAAAIKSVLASGSYRIFE